MILAEYVAGLGDSRGAYRDLMGRPEGKRALGRPRRRWEDFIRMDPQVIASGDIDWIAVAQDRDRWLLNAVMYLRVL
jgi:hypothetical protein